MPTFAPASEVAGPAVPVTLTVFLSLTVVGATFAVIVVATAVAVGVGVGVGVPVDVGVGVGVGVEKPWQPGVVPQPRLMCVVLAIMAVVPWQAAHADGGGGFDVPLTWQCYRC